jgi:hypothetical protein
VIYWTAFGGLFYVMSVIFLVLPIFYFFYAPRFMGISRGAAFVIGIVEIILTAAVTIYGYTALYIGDVVSLSPSKPPASDGTLISTFAIYYILLLVIVAVPTAIAYMRANSDGKRMFNAGWWALVLLFGMYLLNFFTVYNSHPSVGGLLANAKGYIPTPWDTPIFLLFAAVIYVWGVYSGYRTKDLEEVEMLLSKPDSSEPHSGITT